MIRRWLAGLLLVCVSGAVIAQGPAFDPRTWKSRVAGPRTRVLTLGSVHLSTLPGFRPEWMSALLDKVAAFRPDVIAIEGLSGEQCDLLRRNPTEYPGVADQYCGSVEAAHRATGLDLATATAQAAAMLASWPERPTSTARRRLASVLLAAGEPASALVQWWRLAPAERREGDGLDAALVKRLQELAGTPNESYQLAAALAARLGLERVTAMDDHTADAVASEDPALAATLRRLWSGPNPTLDRLKAEPFAGAAPMLATYRLVNRPEMLRGAIDSDFGRALADTAAGGWGRQYVSWWEVRNLRMAANIRASVAQRPGARVLVVVGSSHKPFLDAYLDMMAEVDLVDTEQVLR